MKSDAIFGTMILVGGFAAAFCDGLGFMMARSFFLFIAGVGIVGIFVNLLTDTPTEPM